MRTHIENENWMFRMLEPKRGEVTGGWTELHDEEFYNLSTCITRMIKSYRVRWVRLIGSMAEERNAYINLVRTPEEKSFFGSLG
jgi:hypothetical protein